MTRLRPPFAERGGSVRGLLDLATGCYPGFLFGGSVGNLLPVFHLHEADPAVLRPQLTYLADNGYRTVTTDAIAKVVLEKRPPDPKSVALCFDDCRASLWTVAAPLLRQFGMSAIAFAIPARIPDAPETRPTIDTDPAAALAADGSDVPFATWTELKELRDSGLVDIQSHTYSHSSIFCASTVVDFVTPDFEQVLILNRPAIDGVTSWLSPADLGAPLYPQRSRMSDALRFFDDRAVREQCLEYVASRGGAAFFGRPSWRAELMTIAARGTGRLEDGAERRRAVEQELVTAREMLEARLGAPVPHVCMPWGIGGREVRAALKRTGQQLAFMDRLFSRRAVAPGDDPHQLMRLHERFIFCLPGRGRRHFFTAG